MKYLFTNSGMRILESLCFTNTLFAFDYDGTLSKIVSEPNDANLSPIVRQHMQDLVECARVAIISGRSKDDLVSRIPFKSHYLIGNHGLEGLNERKVNLDQSKRICSVWIEDLRKMFGKSNLDPGLQLEDKIYTLAIHYRHSRQKRIVRDQILAAVQNLHPSPRVITGKSVINLIPPGAPHKGVALLEIMKKEEVTSAFYIGDDDTDEDIFSLPDATILSVRVGRKSISSAPYYIKRQSEISYLLKALIQFHKK